MPLCEVRNLLHMGMTFLLIYFKEMAPFIWVLYIHVVVIKNPGKKPSQKSLCEKTPQEKTPQMPPVEKTLTLF